MPKKKPETFTEKVVKKTRKKKPTVENFYVQGSWPIGIKELPLLLIRPSEEVKKVMGKVKAVASTMDQSLMIWMSGPLGDDIVAKMKDSTRMFIWATYDDASGLVFDFEREVPTSSTW